MIRNIIHIQVPVDTPEQIAEARALLARFGAQSAQVYWLSDVGTCMATPMHVRALDPDPEPTPETKRSA